MTNELEMKSDECRRFLEELEGVAASDAGEAKAPAVLARMSNEARGHAEVCADCRLAVDDLAETRGALLPMSAAVAKPGPWFTARVMAAIRAREKELEERRDGVWLGVRRLAPRLVVLCAVLLVVGTTWAVQLRREDLTRRATLGSAESVFESVPAPLNDDVLVVGQGERP
ncbi:MAG TPA: hypothetical protein VJY15_25160 [Candidatus Acidoferrum sp.]|nr:hypothetical protein [Candidatus Acidoferrum sp.]